MLKINLNELRQYKIIALSGDSKDEEEYIDSYHFFGLIKNIYVKDGELIFGVYGARFPSWNKYVQLEFNHIELKLNIIDIDVYEKKYDNYYTDDYDKDYEYINIKTSNESIYNKLKHFSWNECILLKNFNFKFLKDKIENIVPWGNEIAETIKRDKYVSGLFNNIDEFIGVEEKKKKHIDKIIANYYENQTYKALSYRNLFDYDFDFNKEEWDYMYLDYKKKKDYGYVDDDNPDYEYLYYEVSDDEDYDDEDFYYEDFD